MGRFLPPDHSKGDEKTIGGYMAVHARPAAFEGRDGLSYSVEIGVDETGDPSNPHGAYLLFVRWGRGDPKVSGHLETDFLARAATADEARSQVGALSLDAVKLLLDDLIMSGRGGDLEQRPWWEAMREEREGGGGRQPGGEDTG